MVDRPATKLLAVASGGGHWTELMRLRPAFEEADVTYVTVQSFYAEDVPGQRFLTIPDANRWDRVKLLRVALKLFWIILRIRPDVIVTTGSAPGFIAIRIGRLFRVRTAWIDSFANAEQLSMSGRLAGKHADLWLTQWQHLASDDGPEYSGSVF